MTVARRKAINAVKRLYRAKEKIRGKTSPSPFPAVWPCLNTWTPVWMPPTPWYCSKNKTGPPGTRAALELLHALEKGKTLETYPLLYASIGEYYVLLGEESNALSYLRCARALTKLSAIREALDKKIAGC